MFVFFFILVVLILRGTEMFVFAKTIIFVKETQIFQENFVLTSL